MPELTGVMPVEAVEPAVTLTSTETPAQEPIKSTTIAARITVPVTAAQTTETEPTADKEWDAGILKVYGITLISVLIVVVFAGFLVSHHRRKNQ